MQDVLSFSGVDFRYEPSKPPVLRNFDFELRPGEVTLLAAPNGTGKSTALWLAAGLVAPNRGEVRLLGQDPFEQRDVLGRVGFLAEGAPLPDGWTGRQVLAFQRDTFPQWDDAECERLVAEFGLDLSQRVKSLSRGQRGKLGLVTVLSTKPEVLLLDEPTLGLDVATRRHLLSEILGRVAEHGCSILIAGHEIGEAEAAADRFVLVSDGKVVCNELVSDLLERHRILEWDAPTPPPPEALDLMHLPGPLGRRALAHSWDESLANLWLERGGRAGPADLETIYLSLTGGLHHA
jgi:ABC-2 type transport system ATP-binding protein